MRVLHIADYGAGHYGAFARSLHSLATRLRETDDEIRFAFSGKGPHVEKLSSLGRTSIADRMTSGRYNPSLYSASMDLIGDWRPDIVHGHFGQASLLTGLRVSHLTGARMIWHVRSFLAESSGVRGLLSRLYYRSVVSPRVDCIVAISKALAVDLKRRRYVAGTREVLIIHNGVDCSTVPVSKKAAWDLIKTKTGKPTHSSHAVGMIANFGPEKDLETLFESMEIIWSKIPKCVLVLVGKGLETRKEESESRIRALLSNCSKPEKVLITGQLEDARSIIPAFDAGILLSNSEGFGSAVVEYMVMGLPVIATMTGGLPEIVINGETGLLVKPHDPTEVARHIETLLNDQCLRKRMGEAGRRRALKVFSLSRWVDRIADLYRFLVNRTTLVEPSNIS